MTTNINGTTNTAPNIENFATVRRFMKRLDALTANTDAKNADVLTVRDSLNKAVAAYNARAQELAFLDCDKTDAPLRKLALRACYDRLYIRRKDGVSSAVFRSCRFDVADYLRHVADARKNGATINLPASIDTIKDALKKASEALSAYVLQSINQDTEPMSIKTTAAAVYNYARLYNVDGLKVRPADIRYLAAVVCKAGELGEIRAIKPESVARYMLDMVHVQMKGNGKYVFEAAKKAAKKEEEKKADK